MPTLKIFACFEDQDVLLPADWSVDNNFVWIWGPGGRGADDASAPLLVSGGGGGAGGFKAIRNFGGANELVSVKVGIKNTSNLGASGNHDPAGRSWIKDQDGNFFVDSTEGSQSYAEPGNNSLSQVGGIGGSAGSLAASNAGGYGSYGGGGGGGGAPGPIGYGGLLNYPSGTKGGTGGGRPFDGSAGGAGGGGGGGQGDMTTPAESQATGGISGSGTAVEDGKNGGAGYYGTGAGIGSAGAGAPGTSNTGGGGSGGGSLGGRRGGDGAGWATALALLPSTWISCPFDIVITASGRWAELSDGGVPAGGGAGGGGGEGGDGGDGGFPGGGGGGGGDGGGLGGNGADGFVLFFYFAQDEAAEPPVASYPDVPAAAVDTVDELPPADAIIETQRWLLRTAHLRQFGEITVDDLRVTIKRGVGDTDFEPKLWLRALRDNRSWTKWVKRGLGKTGERIMTLYFGGFGAAKDWQFELATTDDCEIELRKVEIMPTQLGY